MKIDLKLLFSILSLMLFFFNEIPSIEQEHEAAALFEARDYENALMIYKTIDKDNLPDWQKQRILFNQGIILLAQNKNIDALQFFKRISPKQLDYLKFYEMLEANKALAYFQIATSNSVQNIEKSILLKNALWDIFKAQSINCKMQNETQSDSQCIGSENLEKLSYYIVNEIENTRNANYNNYLNSQEPLTIILLINNGIERLLSLIKIFSNSQIPYELLSSYLNYFENEKKSLSILWKTLYGLPFSAENKKIIEKAAEEYFKAINSSNRPDWDKVASQLNEVNALLNQLKINDQENLKELFELQLQLELLLEKSYINEEDILKLKEEIKNKQPLKKEIEQISKYLSNSLENYKLDNLVGTKLFIFAALMELKKISQPTNGILKLKFQNYIEQARMAFNFNLMAQLDEKFNENPLKRRLALHFQDQVLNSKRLINDILQVEKNLYEKKEGIEQSRCQKEPWNKVISLFEEGYKEAMLAQYQLSLSPLALFLASENQKQTIKYWEEALKLWDEKSTQSKEDKKNDSNEKEANKNLKILFKDLQEMQAEDTPRKLPSKMDVQAW